MVRSHNCPECGKPLPFDAPQGLCPACLLTQGLESADFQPLDDFSNHSWTDSPLLSNGMATHGTLPLHEAVALPETEPASHPYQSALSGSDTARFPGMPGRYQLFGEIARGGMGAILRGRDLEFGRELAIKILLEQHCDDPALVRRFVAEARISGRLLLIVTLTLGGLAISWNRHRRSAEFDQAVHNLMVRKAEAESSEDDQGRWATARESGRRLELVLDDAPDAAARSQAVRLIADLAEKSKAIAVDRKLTEDLAEVRDSLDEFPFEQVDAAYRAAFQAAGIDIEKQTPDTVALAIAARPWRVALAAIVAVDRWAAMRGARGDHDGAAKLTAFAHAADADQWRGRLRLAIAQRGHTTRLTTLRELATSATNAELPAVSLSVLGEALLRAGDPAAAEAVLRPAQRQHPSDLGLTLALAQALSALSRRPEAIRYLMMARAIRPESGHALAHALATEQEIDEAIAVFRDLIRLDPAVARNYSCLGKTLWQRGRIEEARGVLELGISVGREAAKRRPDDPFAHLVLGTILVHRGQTDEAAMEFVTAIGLSPHNADAHMNLGLARKHQGRFADAIVELREAIRLSPRDHQAHSLLASVFDQIGRREDAIVELQESARLKPDEPEAHYQLGVALFNVGRLDDALAEYRTAVALKLGIAEVHYNVGHILQLQGHVEDSIAEYRIAISLSPNYAKAHCNLGFQLSARGLYAESLTEFERGHELGSKKTDWPYPSAKWVEDARRIARADQDFAAFLRGEVKPATYTDCLDFANVARTRSFHATAARLWTQAIALAPKSESEPANRIHRNAARSAALAGCGKGNDAPLEDPAARAELPRQARDWLAADLATVEKVVRSSHSAGKKNLLTSSTNGNPKQTSPAFETIANSKSCTKSEQAECRKLWDEVNRLLNESPEPENRK